MKTQTFSVQLPMELSDALTDFADAKFGGNKSDAARVIFTHVLLSEDKHFKSFLASYFNMFPKLYRDFGEVVMMTEREMKRKIDSL